MTKRLTIHLSNLLVVGALLGACSRPVAYFQPEQQVHYSSPTTSVAAKTGQVEQPVPPADAPVATVTVAGPTTQVNASIDQVEVYVRNDHKLAQNKQLSRRIDRLKHLVSASAATETVTSTAPSHKMSVLEQLMMKKLSKKISRHIAPTNPKKPMVNGGLLTGGAVLLIGGLLLLLLSSGTGATIGVIVALVGLLALIFGLLAS